MLLEKYGDDPITVDAALSGLRGREMAVLDRPDARTGSPQTAPQTHRTGRARAIAMLAATIVRGGEEEAVQTLFAWLADGQRTRRGSAPR